jgi:hypothetical protein
MDGLGTEPLFSGFFRDLAVAGRALSAYPRGHPAVAEGLGKAHSALSALLAETGPIELAAARDALFWNDRRFTSPTAAQLAKLLRRRRAAGLLLDPGASTEELETFLRALSVDARSVRDAGSLAAELTAAGLVRIRVSDLDFSSLSLVDGEEQAIAAEVGSLASRVGRRLLASGSVPADHLATWTASGKSAAELLRVVLEGGGRGGSGGGASSGPGALVAAVQAVAAELRESPHEDRARLVHDLASVLSSQAAAVLHRALDEPGTGGRGEAAGAAAARVLPRQLAPIRLAFATDDIDSLRDSETPAAMLASLLELPEDRADRVLSPAAEKVGLVLRNPDLERDPTARLLELAERVDVSPDALPGILGRFAAGYLRLLAAGRIQEAAALVERVQRRAAGEGPATAAFRAAAEKVSGRDAVEALASSLPDLPDEAFGAVPVLVERMGPATVRLLLDILARTENRRMRFRLLDLLTKLGPAVARDAAALLSDPRWYVVRNMLLLLRRVGDVRSVMAVRRCVEHPDLRVRLEAIHNLFAFDREVPRELLRRALHDPDLRQAEAAMELAGKYGISQAVAPIVEYLCAWDPLGKRRAVRLKAIRALAAIADPRALTGLGRFRARFQLFPPAVEERRELYRTLPAYPEEFYQDWAASGLHSRDPEIRRLSAAMGAGQEGAP